MTKDVPDVTVKDWQSVFLSKYRDLLDYFGKKLSMARFNGFSEKPFFLKKIWNMSEEYGQWCYRFKFLKEIRHHWLYVFHAGFEEIRFLKSCDWGSIEKTFVMLSGFWPLRGWGTDLSESVKKGKLVTKIFFSEIVEWSYKSFRKMILKWYWKVILLSNSFGLG